MIGLSGRRGRISRPLEDWNQLTGQDIEQTLMNTAAETRGRSTGQPVVLRSSVARTTALDIADDAWVSVMEELRGSLARANRASRQRPLSRLDFRFYRWSTTKTFLDEITAFMRRLEKIGDWQTWGSKR